MRFLAAIKPLSLLKFLVYGVLIIGVYYSTLSWLITKDWEREAYSYCWLIPPVVFYLIWIKRDVLTSMASAPSWKGLFPLVLGLFSFFIGELSGEFFTLYISLWLVIVGICWMHMGWEKLKIIAFPLFFILTLFPIPHFLNTRLMLQLKLISSKLAVGVIQFFGLPAYREGNIIDLGFTQLQVVDACSGLHSLISLGVCALLLAYFFKDHLWKRAMLLASAVPLAIATNSLRIAATAFLHKYFGPKVAEGFFHEFSGIVIFLVCLPALVLFMKILEKLPPKQIRVEDKGKDTDGEKPETKGSSVGSVVGKRDGLAALRQPVFIAVVLLLGATLVFSRGVEFREKIPMARPFKEFPLQVSGWQAPQAGKMEQMFIDTLDLSDYLLMDYENGKRQQVSFYVAYYESQSKGESIHSPETCLPGGGWSFDQSGTVRITDVPGRTGNMEVNRAVMQSGNRRQIAYFWFPARGRLLTNAYQLKIYNFWDALTQKRTDGALVRLITPIYENEAVADAENRLQGFVRDVVPVLEGFVPGA